MTKSTRAELYSRANLRGECSEPDDEEEVVAVDAFEHVGLVVHLTRIDLVEERHAHERRENKRVVLRRLRLKHLRVVTALDVHPPLLRS